MASLFFCGQSGIWNMRPHISGEPTSLKMPAEPKLYDLQHILQIHIRTSTSAYRTALPSCLFTKSPQRKLSFQRISRAFRAVLGRFCGFRTRKNSWFSRPEVPVRALRRFQNSNSRRFQPPVFVLKTCRFPAVKASLHRCGAAFVVWRRPCCNAVRAPLRPRKALMARRQRFRRFPAARLWSVCDYE